MASDSFTDTNDTEIGSHTAGGVTWGAQNGNALAIGKINSNQLGYGDGFGVSCRASSSSADFCQVTMKAGSYVADTKSVHVRCSASTAGYQLRVAGFTGDTLTGLILYKNEAFLTTADVTAMGKSRLSDITLALKATPAGGDVQLKGYIDGVEVTFAESSASNGSPSTTYTDLAAETPLASGNPGLSVSFESGMDDANSRLDDWTDTQSSGGSAPRASSGLNGGMADMSGGLQ